MARLFMRDFLTLDLRKAEKRLIHWDENGATNALLVRVAATHAGLINGNQRFYRPDKMQAGCGSWVDGETYPRPVLPNHDEMADPLGRVLEAKYIDESWKYAADFPILKDSIFYSSDSKKRMSLWETVDWIEDNLIPLKEYKGLGYIELGLKVTEPDAIQKVLRKEYLTVSVGFATDSAKCSICHQDWAIDDRCEHELGKKYDGRRCWVLTGAMDFAECSFVTHPADPFATTLSVEAMKDSLNREFFLGLSLADQASRLNTAGVVLTDAFYGSDIARIIEDKTPMKLDFNALATELKSADLTEERVLAIRQDLNGFKTDDEGEKKLVKKLKSSVTAKIKANGWDKASLLVPETETESPAAELTDAEKQALAAEVKETPAPTIAATDETQSADPIPPPVQLSDTLKTIVAAVEMKDANEEIVGVVNDLDSKWNGLDETNRRYLRYAVGALISTWYSKEDLSLYLGWLTKDTDSVVVSTTEYKDLTDAIEKFDASERELKDAVTTEETQKLTFLKQAKDALASMIVMHKVLSGAKGYQGLTSAQITDAISKRLELKLPQLLAIRDEILEELQWAKPATQATSTPKADEPAGLEVSDSAQVTEPTPAAGTEEGSQASGTTIENKDSVQEPTVKLSVLSPRERARLAAKQKYLSAGK